VCVREVDWPGKRSKTRQSHLSGRSCHSYFTVPSLSVVSKMLSFKLIVPACVHHINTASSISPFRVSTSRLVRQKNANFKDASRLQRTQNVACFRHHNRWKQVLVLINRRKQVLLLIRQERRILLIITSTVKNTVSKHIDACLCGSHQQQGNQGERK
jgi:hypothetical protein